MRCRKGKKLLTGILASSLLLTGTGSMVMAEEAADTASAEENVEEAVAAEGAAAEDAVAEDTAAGDTAIEAA